MRVSRGPAAYPSLRARQESKPVQDRAHLAALAPQIITQRRPFEKHLGPEMTGELGSPFRRRGRGRQKALPERHLIGVKPRRPGDAAPGPDHAIDRPPAPDLLAPGRGLRVDPGQARRRRDSGPGAPPRPVAISGTGLAAVMAPTSAWPATTSATASSAVSNTRIVGAFGSAPAWHTTLATATWFELPSEVDSAIVTALGSRAKRSSRSAPVRMASGVRTTKAMYSVYRMASGVKRAGSDLATPIRKSAVMLSELMPTTWGSPRCR